MTPLYRGTYSFFTQTIEDSLDKNYVLFVCVWFLPTLKIYQFFSFWRSLTQFKLIQQLLSMHKFILFLTDLKRRKSYRVHWYYIYLIAIQPQFHFCVCVCVCVRACVERFFFLVVSLLILLPSDSLKFKFIFPKENIFYTFC